MILSLQVTAQSSCSPVIRHFQFWSSGLHPEQSQTLEDPVQGSGAAAGFPGGSELRPGAAIFERHRCVIDDFGHMDETPWL